ncbi:MAG: aminopeptidase P family protein [Clostridiales Family XIII bacterium]|jgi:Xaa-Pro aminopeptidase|nr:aminopeptidase P family protein [Clostridiales Family XIII bacterium]
MKGKNPQSGMIKSPKALLAIAKAEALGDACFRYILTRIKPGVTENSIAAEIEKFLRDNGSQGLAFPTICVSGVASNEPHGVPSDKVIEKGDFVVLDFGARIDGYCGDMTRTVAVGEVSSIQENVYDIVLRAQEAAIAVLREGVGCDFVDYTAREIITKAGYGPYFLHGTGHGVGKKVHESPRFNAMSGHVLAEDMPVTVEPGIYLPDKFGVRIEDLLIVTKFGAVNLTQSEKRLIVL